MLGLTYTEGERRAECSGNSLAASKISARKENPQDGEAGILERRKRMRREWEVGKKRRNADTTRTTALTRSNRKFVYCDITLWLQSKI